MVSEPSTFDILHTKGVSEMELQDNRQLVIALKEAKIRGKLTVPMISEMLDEAGTYVSKTTLTRLFAAGSEDNDSFSYNNTLLPLADVLLADDEEDAKQNIEIARLRSEIRSRDDTIAALNNQIEFLHSQISLKDKRMDESAAMIQRVMDRNDRKDITINELMEENKRLDEDIRKLLEKCKSCDKT